MFTEKFTVIMFRSVQEKDLVSQNISKVWLAKSKKINSEFRLIF